MTYRPFLALLLAACCPPGSGDSCREIPIVVNAWCDNARESKVLEIVDGDTLTMEDGESVRILGIDAPEKYYEGHSECSSDESATCCYGEEAGAELESIAPPGTTVRMEFDLECKGVYERTLAYLFVVNEEGEEGEEELFINQWLIEEGFARVYSSDVGQAREIRYYSRFQEAQSRSQANQKGLWGECL